MLKQPHQIMNMNSAIGEYYRGDRTYNLTVFVHNVNNHLRLKKEYELRRTISQSVTDT